MKYSIRILLSTFFLALSLYGDVEDISISTAKIEENADESGKPFAFFSNYDAVAPANFSDRQLKHQKLKFQQFDTSLNAVVYYNKRLEEGVALGVGYTYNRIAWRQNPFFDQKNFNALNVLVTGFTKRLTDWDWKAQVFYALDSDQLDFDDYSTWDLLLWGRYTYSCLTGIHFGFYAQTGMEADRVTPLFGFDWQFLKEWKLNAIFPVNLSLVYTFADHWSTLLAVRFLSARCRTGKNEPVSRAIVEYRNTGIELAIQYEWDPYITANFHAGYASGNRLKISNRRHNHSHHFKFDSSPYVGAMANLSF